MKSLTFSKKNDSAVYMDRPNTNWEVFGLLKEHQNEEEQPSLFCVGSCRLLVIHGALQTRNSKTKWNV